MDLGSFQLHIFFLHSYFLLRCIHNLMKTVFLNDSSLHVLPRFFLLLLFWFIFKILKINSSKAITININNSCSWFDTLSYTIALASSPLQRLVLFFGSILCGKFWGEGKGEREVIDSSYPTRSVTVFCIINFLKKQDVSVHAHFWRGRINLFWQDKAVNTETVRNLDIVFEREEEEKGMEISFTRL